jgi:hypothetical protein
MKENRHSTPEVWSSVMAQYEDLCKDDEPSYQIINEIYFILVPKEKMRKCLLKLLDKEHSE